MSFSLFGEKAGSFLFMRNKSPVSSSQGGNTWGKGKGRESSSTNTPMHGADAIGSAPDPGFPAKGGGSLGLARQGSAASTGAGPAFLSRMSGGIPPGQIRMHEGGATSTGHRKAALHTRCFSGELILRSTGNNSPPPAGIERRVASMVPVINPNGSSLLEAGAGGAEAGVGVYRPGSGGRHSPAGEVPIRAGSTAGQHVLNDPLLGQMSIAAIHTGLATSPGAAETCICKAFSRYLHPLRA